MVRFIAFRRIYYYNSKIVCKALGVYVMVILLIRVRQE